MNFGPTPFPRQPVRAIIIRPGPEERLGYTVGAATAPRNGWHSAWIEPPRWSIDLTQAWMMARDLRKRTGLPILDRTEIAPAPPSGPLGGMAA